MKLHLLTLKFSGNSSKLEAPFLSDYYRVSLPHIRISLVLGALLYAAFGILDALLMPEQKSTIWFIRFIIVCPVIFGTLLASFSKSFERYMQPLLAGVFILAGGGIICMIVIAPPPVSYSYYAGLLLVFMWGYTFIRILFIWASLAGWVVVALYEIAAIWISPTPFAVLLNNNFFFIGANVIGMLACYSIEFYARRDFFLTQQLESEREKINEVNQELEERVEKRTGDYQIINRALEQEITGHKQVAEALRESESKYRFMTDNVADIIWTVDMNLDFTYISPSVQRFRGFTVEEAMSQKIHEVLTPASLQYALKVMEEENKTLMSNPDRIRDKLTIELEEYCKDGSTIWTENELKYLPDQDGKPIGIIGVTRDISARKQAEEALRESEEFFKEITENSSDVIIITDKNGNIKYCSRSIERFSGYKPEELIGRSGFTFVHPDDVERAVDDYGKAILTPDSAIPNEFRVVRKDGEVRYFDGLGKNLLDNPAVAGFVMNIRDITERKRVEEVLRQSNEQYRLLANHTTDIVWLLNRNLETIYTSPNVEKLRGFTPQEIMEIPPEKHLTPESFKLAYKIFTEELPKVEADLHYNPVHSLELEFYRKDGTTFWAETMFSIIRDGSGKPVSILGEGRDITDRKRAKEALRESKERYQALVENASDIVFRTDNNGHFTFVNASAIRITGYEEEEIIGKHYPTLIHPDMRDEAIKFFGRQFVKGLQNTYSEYLIIKKDGHEVWLGQNTQLIVEDGNVTGFQAVSRDITERKRLEKELRDSEERYRELSIIDGLTQLYNSRYFYHQLKMEIDRLARYEHPLTLLLLDLDNFKAFNDAYGHIEGDQVLLRLGQVIKRCLRKTDSAYRYGGEEFTIILPMTTSKEGAVTAERIRAEFKKENFSPLPGKHVHITVSIGLAQYKKKESMKAFVHRADQLMYQGKKNGKDRICSES